MKFHGYLISPKKVFDTSNSPLQGPKEIKCHSVSKSLRNFQFKFSGYKANMFRWNILGPKIPLCTLNIYGQNIFPIPLEF